jgi:hypothetical protein
VAQCWEFRASLKSSTRLRMSARNAGSRQLLIVSAKLGQHVFRGGTTVRTVSDISKHQRLKDNKAERTSCAKSTTMSLQVENWIDETERRTWFLSEIVTALAAVQGAHDALVRLSDTFRTLPLSLLQDMQ